MGYTDPYRRPQARARDITLYWYLISYPIIRIAIQKFILWRRSGNYRIFSVAHVSCYGIIQKLVEFVNSVQRK